MKWSELYEIIRESDHVFAFAAPGSRSNVGTGFKINKHMLLAAVGHQALVERMETLPDAPLVDFNEDVGKTSDDWLSSIGPHTQVIEDGFLDDDQAYGGA